MISNHIKGINHFGIQTADFDSTASFLINELDFDTDSEYTYERAGCERHVAYLRRGGMCLEVCSCSQPPEPQGRFVHIAFDVAELDSLYAQLAEKYGKERLSWCCNLRPQICNEPDCFSFTAPAGELYLFYSIPGHTYSGSRNVSGRGHAALCVSNLESSVAFYRKLGFTPSHRTDYGDPANPVKTELMIFGAGSLALIQTPVSSDRGEGWLNHLSLYVDDPQLLFEAMNEENVQLSARGVLHFCTEHIDVVYFNALGPDGEVLELSRVLR